MARENWHRALDVQLDVHKWCTEPYGDVYLRGFFESLFEPTTERLRIDVQNLANHTVQHLWRGDTMYVTSDMLHLLAAAAEDLPDDATIDIRSLLCNQGFALFEEPLYGIDINDQTFVVNAISWEASPFYMMMGADSPQEVGELMMGVMVYFWSDAYDTSDESGREATEHMQRLGVPIPPLVLSHVYPTWDGRTVPEIKEDEPATVLVSRLVRMFWSMQLLAQQTIGEPIRMRPNRAQRRRLDREFPGTPERMLTLITLRRKKAQHNDEPQKVEWSRRWRVRGHWRKQWYPSLKRHEYKYIHEYIKGPDDKPFMTGRRVFDFRR